MSKAQHLGECLGTLASAEVAALLNAAADCTLVLDARGRLCQFSIQDPDLARALGGGAGWEQQRWLGTLTPDSDAAARALLSDVPRSPLRWRHVEHRREGAADVPMLYAVALQTRDGGRVLLGRDPTRMDLPGLLLAGHVSAAHASLRARQVSAEALCLDTLAPAARRLGELWVDDRCDCAAVTAGVGVLRHMLRELDADFTPPIPANDPPRRILLATAPGEQHGLGLAMVAAFLRRAGWAVTLGEPRANAIAAQLRDEDFAILGLSVSSDRLLPVLRSTIRLARRASRNRSLAVMVGGPIFNERPGLAVTMGADATAADAQQAVIVAAELLIRAAPRGRVRA